MNKKTNLPKGWEVGSVHTEFIPRLGGPAAFVVQGGWFDRPDHLSYEWRFDMGGYAMAIRFAGKKDLVVRLNNRMRRLPYKG